MATLVSLALFLPAPTKLGTLVENFASLISLSREEKVLTNCCLFLFTPRSISQMLLDTMKMRIINNSSVSEGSLDKKAFTLLNFLTLDHLVPLKQAAKLGHSQFFPSILFSAGNLAGNSEGEERSFQYEATASVVPSMRGPCLAFNAPTTESVFVDSEFTKTFQKVKTLTLSFESNFSPNSFLFFIGIHK